MNQEKLLYFKGLLESRLRALIEEAGKTMTDMVEDKKEGFPDLTDRASPIGSKFHASNKKSGTETDYKGEGGPRSDRGWDFRRL